MHEASANERRRTRPTRQSSSRCRGTEAPVRSASGVWAIECATDRLRRRWPRRPRCAAPGRLRVELAPRPRRGADGCRGDRRSRASAQVRLRRGLPPRTETHRPVRRHRATTPSHRTCCSTTGRTATPPSSEAAQEYRDALGRPCALATVRSLGRGDQAAGAARARVRRGVRRRRSQEWSQLEDLAVLTATGKPWALGDFLQLVDPAAQEWLGHFISELEQAVRLDRLQRLPP